MRDKTGFLPALLKLCTEHNVALVGDFYIWETTDESPPKGEDEVPLVAFVESVDQSGVEIGRKAMRRSVTVPHNDGTWPAYNLGFKHGEEGIRHDDCPEATENPTHYWRGFTEGRSKRLGKEVP